MAGPSHSSCRASPNASPRYSFPPVTPRGIGFAIAKSGGEYAEFASSSSLMSAPRPVTLIFR